MSLISFYTLERLSEDRKGLICVSEVTMNILLLEDYMRTSLRRQRVLRDRLSPLDHFDDVELKRLFRFDRANLIILIDSIDTFIDVPTNRNHPLSPAQRVCVCLNYLGGGTYQRTLGAWFGVDQSTISRSNWKVMETIYEIHKSTISFPVDLSRVKSEFESQCKIPNIIGAIDCTHVEILKPHSEAYPDHYINRKGWPSINVQAICDSKTRFLSVSAEWPGSVHDSRIFSNSSVYHKFITRVLSGVLLADSGYPQLPFLATPFTKPTTDDQHRYNRAVSSGRVVIERSFGCVKQRFRCLCRPLTLPLRRQGTQIMVCFILHNFSLSCHDETPSDDLCLDGNERDQPLTSFNEDDGDYQLRRQGGAFRQNLLRLFREDDL